MFLWSPSVAFWPLGHCLCFCLPCLFGSSLWLLLFSFLLVFCLPPFSYPGASFPLRNHYCSHIHLYSTCLGSRIHGSCSRLDVVTYFCFARLLRLFVTLGVCIVHSIPMSCIIVYFVYNRKNYRSKVIPDIPCMAKPSPCFFCCYTPTSLHKGHLWVLILSNSKAMST